MYPLGRSWLGMFYMSRPDQLLLILAIYLFGAVVAIARGFTLDSTKLLFGAIPLLMISASIHFANEYADYETDQLTKRTAFSGGSGAFLKYGIAKKKALRAAWLSLVMGLVTVLLGWVKNLLVGDSILILGLGGFLGWMYSLRPLALAWKGWGELDNAFLGSILLPFYGFTVLRGELEFAVILLFLPFGFFAFNNLLAVMWADRYADELVGKKTLAVQLPKGVLNHLYWAVLIACLMSIALLSIWELPHEVGLASLLAFPIGAWAGWKFTRIENPYLSVLAMLVLFGLQFAAWWIAID